MADRRCPRTHDFGRPLTDVRAGRLDTPVRRGNDAGSGSGFGATTAGIASGATGSPPGRRPRSRADDEHPRRRHAPDRRFHSRTCCSSTGYRSPHPGFAGRSGRWSRCACRVVEPDADERSTGCRPATASDRWPCATGGPVVGPRSGHGSEQAVPDPAERCDLVARPPTRRSRNRRVGNPNRGRDPGRPLDAGRSVDVRRPGDHGMVSPFELVVDGSADAAGTAR